MGIPPSPLSHPIPDTHRLLLMGFAAGLISPGTAPKLLYVERV